jgi:cyclase
MKRALVAAAFVCLLAGTFRREGVSDPGLVKELAPGIFYRQAEPEKRIIANTGWIVFRDWVVVVDANFPWGARAILNDLRRTTDKPVRFVFDTHYHSDHAFGNGVFTGAGAAIVCSEDCAAESRDKNARAWAEDKGTGEYSLKQYQLVHPQVVFRDRMTVEDGAHRLELLRVGPAHTKGDAVAWLPNERVLFAGDLVVSNGGNYLGDPDADLENWVRALDRVTGTGAAVVVPGHGNHGGLEAVRGNRAYLADLVAQVGAGIKRGATSEQLEKEVDLSRHQPWGADAARNRAAVRTAYAKLSRR